MTIVFLILAGLTLIIGFIIRHQEKSMPKNSPSYMKSPTAFRNSIIVCLVFMILAYFSYDNTTDNHKTDVSTKKVEAYTASHQFIRDRIKTPTTAEFPWSADDATTYEGDSIFVISSYVDYQNEFSAKIRSKYIAKLKYNGESKWQLLDLKMD